MDGPGISQNLGNYLRFWRARPPGRGELRRSSLHIPVDDRGWPAQARTSKSKQQSPAYPQARRSEGRPWQRRRAVGERVEVGEQVGPFARTRHTAEGHVGAGNHAPGIIDERVEVVDGPVAAFALQR